ncbi:MAG TPA: GntR family transcriptional regulator [Planctomycetaceae bacterium]|nr:GntR family transcriptional regulator [Planctomycetaceae bacterium]
MQIKITPGSTLSIYQQIAAQIRQAVAAEQIELGAAMPSVRQLAKDLVVNPNTVAKAYGELVRDGVLQSQQGRGYFVARRKSIFTRRERLRRLDAALDTAIGEAVTLDFSADELSERLQYRLGQLLPKQAK